MSSQPRTLYDKVDSVIVKIFRYVSYISGVCLIAIMFVAFFNVLGEKIFHKGIPASTEIIQYLHIPVVFLACAYVTVDTGHTRIDLLCKHFPVWLQTICMTVGNLIGAFICAFVGCRGIVQMNKFLATHAKSSTTGVGFAKWPFALIFSVGFFLLAFSFLWSIVRQFAKKAPEAAPEAQEKEVQQ